MSDDLRHADPLAGVQTDKLDRVRQAVSARLFGLRRLIVPAIFFTPYVSTALRFRFPRIRSSSNWAAMNPH